MKKISAMVFTGLILAMFGCSKNAVEAPKEEATKFSLPAWRADSSGRYFATMTAVFRLSDALSASVSENDLLAAFVNGECRGVGVVVKIDNTNLFFLLVQGASADTDKVVFKYYSTKTSYMYDSNTSLNFLVDAVHGTAANPKLLELTQLK